MNNKSFIELPTFDGTEFINHEDVFAIKADDKHIRLILEGELEKQVRMPIGKAEKKLNFPYFVRCHRSFIVNILKIKGRFKNGLQLKLQNDKNIPISKSYKKAFDLELQKYSEKLGR